MKFDLSWFTTIPGILITCGVVLLIVALIIFIVTSKKGKQDNKNVGEGNSAKGDTAAVSNPAAAPTSTATVTQVADNSPQVTAVENQNVQPVNVSGNDMQQPADYEEAIPIPVEPVEVSNNVPQSTLGTETIANVEPQNVNSTVQPEVITSVQSTPTVEVVNNVPTVQENLTPAVEVPTIDITPTPVAVENPTVNVTPAVETLSTGNQASIPAIDVQPVNTVNEQAQVNTIPEAQNTASIYGGVSQIIPNINLEQNTSRQIYGGADPLENTQTIPVVKNEPTIPSVQSIPNESTVIPVVDNTTENIMPTPTVETSNLVPTPTVETTNSVPMPSPQVTTENAGPVGIQAEPVAATAPLMPPEL